MSGDNQNSGGGGGGGGGDNQGGKNKGGGGGQKSNGVSLVGSFDAANIGLNATAIKKSIADNILNAVGFIFAGIVIAVAKKAVYQGFSLNMDAEVKPKVSAWEGANAMRELKANSPDKFAKLVEKNPDLFDGTVPAKAKDVTPE